MEASGQRMSQILITGPPGVGKTTLVRNVTARLINERPDLTMNGFYTQEMRDKNGQRSGFEVVSVVDEAERGTLAVVAAQGTSGPKVGKYSVTVGEFESIALPCFRKDCSILVVDEVGKMEAFSGRFSSALADWLSADQRPLLLATVPLVRRLPLAEKVREKPNSLVITVDRSNRDHLVEKLFDIVVHNSKPL